VYEYLHLYCVTSKKMFTEYNINYVEIPCNEKCSYLFAAFRSDFTLHMLILNKESSYSEKFVSRGC
jgi:hypothetical protein